MNSTQISHKPGFTLVEVIIVLSIIALSFPILFSTLFVVTRQQVSTNRLTDVKQQGDAVMNYLTTQIRNNAIQIQTFNGVNWVSACEGASAGVEEITNSTTPIYGSISFLNGETQSDSIFKVAKGQLCRQTRPDAPADIDTTLCEEALTNRSVVVSDLLIQCINVDTTTSPFVEISFVLTGAKGEAAGVDSSTMNFSTKVQLRRKTQAL
ncbi:MAG: type II secretion system protein [bacterium]